jgi:2-methylcitrate dehydratase
MWKGAATAAAARMGIFAARLAREGMTGPDAAIEGRHGFWQQVSGPFSIRPFGPPDAPWVCTNTSIKFFPAEVNAHGALEMMQEVRQRVPLEQIQRMKVRTYWFCFDEIAGEPEKWAPTTRETADHSLPYMMASCLLEGYIARESFDDAHLGDERIRELMGRIEVVEDKDYSEAWPREICTSVTVETKSGEEIRLEVKYPKGHPKNPGTAEDIAQKFMLNTRGILDEAAAIAILDGLQGLRALRARQIVDLLDGVRSELTISGAGI